MKREIKFYIPKNERIPTGLHLYVDGIIVMYERTVSGFRFEIPTDDETEALAIATDIAGMMIQDHDESQHGVSWRTTSFRIVDMGIPNTGFTWVDWSYRVRDSY